MSETAEGLTAGGQISDKAFLCAVRDMANRNRDFADGEIDSVDIEVREGEVVFDTDDPDNIVIKVIEFHAFRERYQADLADVTDADREAKKLPEPKIVLVFEVGKTACLDYIALPPEIAVNAYDDPKQQEMATEEPIFRRQMKEHFRIGTANRVLKACQRVEYYDGDDTLVYGGCPWDEEDEQDDTVSSDVSDWLSSLGIANTVDSEGAGAFDTLVEMSFAEEQHDNDLSTAMRMLGELNEQILKWAGIEVSEYDKA